MKNHYKIQCKVYKNTKREDRTQSGCWLALIILPLIVNDLLMVQTLINNRSALTQMTVALF